MVASRCKIERLHLHFNSQMSIDFSLLRKNLKKDCSALPKVRVAVLGDFSTQLFVQALRGWGIERGFDFLIYEADIGQIDLQIMDADSALYEFKPDFVVILPSPYNEHKRFTSQPAELRSKFSSNYCAWANQLRHSLAANSDAKVILSNLPLFDDSVFGNFANKVDQSWVHQSRRINHLLLGLTMYSDNVYIADFDLHRTPNTFDIRMKVNADMDYSLDFLPTAARAVSDIILAVKGVVKKCVIVDLDNTIWGGVIGDDGIERIQIGELGIGKAFNNLQRWLKQLKERGIILCVCSKNTEAIAWEPFDKHPDMILRREDIAVFVANWESKVNNIRHIQKVLNIGFDSMVFLDDNPAERALIRENIAGIAIPELPEDPAEYWPYLCSLNLFETTSFTGEDVVRTKLYQEEASRTELLKSFQDEGDFLKSLNMKCLAKPFDAFSIPRIAQLSQRSNQFNLRTVRYTETDLTKMVNDPKYFTCSFSMQDKFGDYGLIAAVILEARGKELFIDTWIMSCRVLKRGMENFTLNKLIAIARENGFEKISGEYLPTAKNGIVANLLNDLGFSGNGVVSCDVASYSVRPTLIAAE